MDQLNQGSGFAAGTLVHTDKGLVPIQNIKVGDMVLSRHESGEGELAYQPVMKVNIYENKELWFVAINPYKFSDINGRLVPRALFRSLPIGVKTNFIATPNHPVWVVGKGVWDQGMVSDFKAYPQPKWKRVDQLQEYEMVVTHQGVLFSVERAQPLYQFKSQHEQGIQPDVAWYKYNYYITPETEDYDDYDLELGRALDISKYMIGDSRHYLTDQQWNYNSQISSDRQYFPYLGDVYNIEVNDSYTYFVHAVGVCVHNSPML